MLMLICLEEGDSMKKTPLYDIHMKLGGKMIDFGGWALPVQYSSIIEEHKAVRERAGLFDVSHMGEIIVEGPSAFEFLQRMVTNDISGISQGRAIYTPMCYPDGGTVDDFIIYQLEEDKYLLVVNASNTDKDYEWLMEHRVDGVEIHNVSCDYAQLAIQGPAAQSILQKLTDTPLGEIRFFRFAKDVEIAGVKSLVSRTGYTGEDGFEIYFSADKAVELWEKIMEAGEGEGMLPAGLGARDTLRFEAGLVLYGNELSQEITPLEAGLGRFVKLGKEYFIGKDALVKQSEEGLERTLVGFEMIDRGIPRSQYKIYHEDKEIGLVTSGSFAPTLQKNLGLALIDSAYSEIGTEISVIVRKRSLKAKLVELPFYSRKAKKPSK